MCIDELDCLKLIQSDLLDIKAFCYALAVGLVLFSIIFILNKIFNIFIKD